MAREFIVDGRTFPDPDPNRSVEEVKRMMESFFPELANAETREHKTGENASYEFVRRVGTKGSGSWKAQIATAEDPDWVDNGIRLATKKEAVMYACDLASRWTAVVESRITESEDPVNYTYENGTLVSIPVPVLQT